jgi:hypothetical protein
LVLPFIYSDRPKDRAFMMILLTRTFIICLLTRRSSKVVMSAYVSHYH